MGYVPCGLLYPWSCTERDCVQIWIFWGTSQQRMIVGIWANPWRRCVVVHASWRVVKPTTCRWLWRLYPFLLTCWILEGWRSLTQPREHAVRTLDTSLFHVSCSKHPSGCFGMTVHMGWTPVWCLLVIWWSLCLWMALCCSVCVDEHSCKGWT